MHNPEELQKKLVGILRDKGITDPRVLQAFLRVPRHKFVDEALFDDAYTDQALPIGNGQTISQPYVVALMTQALELNSESKVLEIGTGSGFQAAILAQFTRRVFTVERDPVIGKRARERLRTLACENVIFKIGDGTLGWLANAPYDRIIVTAGAPREIPASLLAQLSETGRMLIPAGDRACQQLLVVDKKGATLTRRNIGDVVFVPLVGRQGW